MEEIICMAADQWEEYHIQRARLEARVRQNVWNRKHEADRERRIYFCTQKIIGVVLILAICILTFLIGNIACLILAFPGIGLIATKKMIVVNKYWWTNGGPDQWM